MNQAKLTPKPDLTLLAVVVPKEAFEFYLHEQAVSYFIPYGEYWKKIREMIDMNLIDEYSYLEDVGTIIGILSQLTEEQAKEIVLSGDIGIIEGVEILLFEDYSGGEPLDTAQESIQSLIESSGLTYRNKEDVLLIKIN